MRALEPVRQGYVVAEDGVRIGYEVFGSGERTVVFPPIDSITHSRCWKAQVPYLARSSRVVTIDPRGNGRSDRPSDPEAYGDLKYVGDTIAVMDELGIDRAVLIGICVSAWQSLVCAYLHPERVQGVVAIAPWTKDDIDPETVKSEAMEHFEDVSDGYEGWRMRNRHYWKVDWPGYVDFFFHQVCADPHSSKLIDDMVAYACETTGEIETMVETAAEFPDSLDEAEAVLTSIACPVLVMHAVGDACQPFARGERVARLTGGELIRIESQGHIPPGREPVMVNLRIREFLDRVVPVASGPTTTRWTHAMTRPPRILYLSSPIGLGHARRDLAIARALRTHRPDVSIEWLTQEPVSSFLAGEGEYIHPASHHLANESRHIETCAGEHDLHAFQAIREMDEIMVANFMVFNELVTDDQFDLFVGDEAWDVDHFLHENPELKRAPFAWMTDFVGWIPMPDGGEREAWLTADYNAEMIEHVARYPTLRDRSIFVGDTDDLVDLPLGPGLPSVRKWTEEHFDFSGYVMGERPTPTDRSALRKRLGYRSDEVVCLVSVGGSGVGEHLLRRIVAAYPKAKERIPGLRMVVVTGPRIDPAAFDPRPGVEIHGFVPDLDLHHATCDIAVVQGGLTTTMELTANGRPFLYFPLRHHFEQQVHVRHRLDRHRAGRAMDYATSDPSAIASALVEELARPLAYHPVPTDGADRAATLLAELI